MKWLGLLLIFQHTVALAYEIYDPNSGGTFYVRWCSPVEEKIQNLEYISCNDSSNQKKPFVGACSNLQSDCGSPSPSYPVQTGLKPSNDKWLKAKKKWEYFNLDQAAKVGFPSSFKPEDPQPASLNFKEKKPANLKKKALDQKP